MFFRCTSCLVCFLLPLLISRLRAFTPSLVLFPSRLHSPLLFNLFHPPFRWRCVSKRFKTFCTFRSCTSTRTSCISFSQVLTEPFLQRARQQGHHPFPWLPSPLVLSTPLAFVFVLLSTFVSRLTSVAWHVSSPSLTRRVPMRVCVCYPAAGLAVQLAGAETELALQFVRCIVVVDDEPEVRTLPVLCSEDTLQAHLLNTLLFHAVRASSSWTTREAGGGAGGGGKDKRWKQEKKRDRKGRYGTGRGSRRQTRKNDNAFKPTFAVMVFAAAHVETIACTGCLCFICSRTT